MSSPKNKICPIMSLENIELGGRPIGPSQPPFVIAEMSGNHNGSLSRALEIVEAAAEAGVNAVKLQTYTPDTMTLDCDGPGFRIDDPASPWHGRRLYELYEEAHTPWDWHAEIFEKCRDRGMLFLSSPFDSSAVDFLESLEVPAYKIASFENSDFSLLERVALTNKPILMSTGTATLDELDESVDFLREAGCKHLILMKCTSAYPALPEEINLRNLMTMRERFKVELGLSDHTLGTAVSVAAVGMGAGVIEKHFTLSRGEGGVDSAFSLEPDEMRTLVNEVAIAWKALGNSDFRPTEGDSASAVFRRSIYVVKDLEPGDVLREDCVRVVRPGLGLPPKALKEVIGKVLIAPATRGTPLSWDLLAD